MTNAQLDEVICGLHRRIALTTAGTPLQDDLIKAVGALRIAVNRIAELEDDLRNSTISNPERFKVYDYTVRDLILFADICKRNDVREADLKQAAWNLELAVRAVMNERAEIVKNTMNEIAMRFTPDFEKAYEEGKEVTV